MGRRRRPARPFAEESPLPIAFDTLREMELFVNFGLGDHSNDARAVLSDYTVLDFAARYRAGPIEVGFAIENITDTSWRSSEFYYESQPTPTATPEEDFHFSPGNPRNVRAWLAATF